MFCHTHTLKTAKSVIVLVVIIWHVVNNTINSLNSPIKIISPFDVIKFQFMYGLFCFLYWFFNVANCVHTTITVHSHNKNDVLCAKYTKIVKKSKPTPSYKKREKRTTTQVTPKTSPWQKEA